MPRSSRRLDPAGGLLAVALFTCSLTPSLLPRSWYVQGTVSGVAVLAGYGIGTAVGRGARVLPWRPPPGAVASAGRAAALLSLVSIGAALQANVVWQRDTRRLIGLPAPPWYQPFAVLIVSAVVLMAGLAVARQLRRGGSWSVGRLRPVFPQPVAGPASVVVVALIAGLGLRGFWLVGLLPATNATFADINGGGFGAPPPCVTACSRIPWDSLGRFGQRFLSETPTVGQLAAFNGSPAKQPIRVYAGLRSADGLAAEADLAVAELDRIGGFGRKTLLVATSTGTGWVDPNAAAALEYMYNGDTATVSMQYSYLPSPVSFVADRDEVSQASKLLFDRVRARWLKEPPATRPRLLVFGESLGALGSQNMFRTVTEAQRLVDGALWEGPPNSSPLWASLQRQRRPGSPAARPVLHNQPATRVVSNSRDLGGGPPPRTVFLQHPSDPVVWWSPHLILHRPGWLAERRGSDVSPRMHWYPLVSFLQVTADLAWATRVPDGHGHNYHTDAVAAWARIVPAPGWTARDTARLRHVIAARPRL